MSDHRIRPKLADGEHWPEPDRWPWRGPTERGRRLIGKAWERLRDAPEWHRSADPDPDPWLNDTDATPDGTSTNGTA